ncbi:MAG: DoxX family protein [Prosthecobacter sp.]
MLKLLNLSFLPKSTDFGLLVLRVALGFSMLLLHGRGKLLNFSAFAPKFEGYFGLPGNVNLGLAVFAEVFCSALLIAGFLTRFASLMLAVTMATAFYSAHKLALVGPNSGELAMVYLIGYVALLCAGAGRISVDRS